MEVIAVSRRTHMLVAGLMAALAGCSGGEDDSSSSHSGAPVSAEVGQCRNAPPRPRAGPDAWYEDSPVVDCTDEHTLETLFVVDTDEVVTADLVDQLAPFCDDPSVVEYLGSPGFGAYAVIYPIVHGPTPEESEAGERWVRCDAGVATTTADDPPLATLTTTMRHGLSEHLGRYLMCLDEVRDVERVQPLTSCEQPHRSELLRDPVQLEVEAYPPPAALERKGRAACAELVTDRADADQLLFSNYWIGEDEWDGGALVGGCWIRRESGLLPAL